MPTPDDSNYRVGLWSTEFPELLEKNFLGISRLWDQAHPYVLNVAFPERGGQPWHFQSRIRIHPGLVAELVGEGANTPLEDEFWTYEKFVSAETRAGFQVFERETKFGLGNIVSQRSEAITDSINKRLEWEAIKALRGVTTRLNSDQSVARLQSAAATDEWDAAAATGAPLTDIINAIKLIHKASGFKATHIFLPLDEYYWLHDHGDILDQMKYTDPSLLTDGMLSILKGLKLVEVTGFYKTDPTSFDPDDKTFIMQDQVIVAACPVGYLSIAEPLTIRRWEDEDTRSLFVQEFKSFIPVVEDYGKICVITNTNTDVATAVPAQFNPVFFMGKRRALTFYNVKNLLKDKKG